MWLSSVPVSRGTGGCVSLGSSKLIPFYFYFFFGLHSRPSLRCLMTSMPFHCLRGHVAGIGFNKKRLRPCRDRGRIKRLRWTTGTWKATATGCFKMEIRPKCSFIAERNIIIQVFSPWRDSVRKIELCWLLWLVLHWGVKDFHWRVSRYTYSFTQWALPFYKTQNQCLAFLWESA